MEQASVPEVLASVEASVLQDILAADLSDDLVVPEGQEPSNALVVHPVVAAGATAVAICRDPNDPVVAEQPEAHPLALVVKSPAYSPTSSGYSSRTASEGDSHDRRKKPEQEPKAKSARIQKKPPHKRPKPQEPLTPKEPAPVLTARQKAVRAAERRATRDWLGDKADAEWHRRNCCRICGSASHWWKQCDVQHCVYCQSNEHRKLDRFTQEVICPKLKDKQERDRVAERKAKEAREKDNFYSGWADELSNTYYDTMYRPNRVPHQPRGRVNNHGQPFGTPNMRQRGNDFSDRGRYGSPGRTWFRNDQTESFWRREQSGYGHHDDGDSDLYPDSHRRGSPGPLCTRLFLS